MSDKIEIKYKINEIGEVKKFRREGVLEIVLAQNFTFKGIISITINNTVFTFSDARVFQFMLSLFSGLNGLLIRNHELNIVDILTHCYDDGITLRRDGEILHINSYNENRTVTCSFFDLYYEAYKIVKELLNLLYETDPSMAKLIVPDNSGLEGIRLGWLKINGSK